MLNTNLPSNFPRTITIKLQEGLHNGYKQLWASFTHEGKNHKLVIIFDRYTPLCDKGETWEVQPVKSPNGHIVFCRLTHMLKTARGEHPFEELVRAQIQDECAISLQAYPLGSGTRRHARAWEKIGLPKSLVADKATFLVEVAQAVIKGNRDVKYSLAEKFLIEIPVDQCVVRNHEICFHDAQYLFVLHFRNHGHDPEEYVSEKGYGDDDDYYREPREPDLDDLERREEHYWSRSDED